MDYWLKHCWKAFLTVSLLRLRAAAGESAFLTRLDDRDLTQLICVLCLTFPQIGLVLSTCELQRLREMGYDPVWKIGTRDCAHDQPRAK
ncbi:MAG: hypothetical protein R3F23_07890 [Verrucomicrobiia bacterium]